MQGGVQADNFPTIVSGLGAKTLSMLSVAGPSYIMTLIKYSQKFWKLNIKHLIKKEVKDRF